MRSLLETVPGDVPVPRYVALSLTQARVPEIALR